MEVSEADRRDPVSQYTRVHVLTSCSFLVHISRRNDIQVIGRMSRSAMVSLPRKSEHTIAFGRYGGHQGYHQKNRNDHFGVHGKLEVKKQKLALG